ncbi:MAG: hypothetical protein O3A51_04745 [Verrucomicrobia bacterium]|nr:hypothetical protein [Verrucomicrobiota bacterium]
MERLWPALQDIDTSSGALGNAVHKTLVQLITVLVSAPADRKVRGKWLERVFAAIENDGVQYLSPVEDRWGEICVFPELANAWADSLLPMVRAAWSDRSRYHFVTGDTACLSCLLELGRYQALNELLALRSQPFWPFDRFGAEALARQGLIDAAVAYAEARRKDGYDDASVTEFCERVLLDASRRDEAYRKYGLHAARANTYLAVFRATTRKYPEQEPRQVLTDLIAARGDQGKWFAAAKSAGFLDIALDCARLGTTEPATLLRAARDFVDKEPQFSAQIALQAISDLLAGKGYEPTAQDLMLACDHFLSACGDTERGEDVLRRVLLDAETGVSDGNMCAALRRRLGEAGPQ